MGQVFNKGLEKDEKSEGLLKILRNIEDKTDSNLRAIESSRNNDNMSIKSVFDKFKKELPPEGQSLLNNILEKARAIDYSKLQFTGGNKHLFTFSDYTKVGKLFDRIYKGEILIPEAEREENAFDYDYEELENYKPKKDGQYYTLKEDLLENAKLFKETRQIIIKAYKDKVFPLIDPK